MTEIEPNECLEMEFQQFERAILFYQIWISVKKQQHHDHGRKDYAQGPIFLRLRQQIFSSVDHANMQKYKTLMDSLNSELRTKKKFTFKIVFVLMEWYFLISAIYGKV